MDIIGKKYIFLTISGTLMLASALAISVWGLNLGIDFTGGSLLEIEFQDERPAVVEIQNALTEVKIEALVQPSGDQGLILRFRPLDEAEHQEILSVFSRLGTFTERRFDAIGPTIGEELKRKSVMALGLAIAAIILYIAWAFRKVSSPPHQKFGVGARPVSSWGFGLVAIVALAHDVVIPAGVFAVLGRFYQVEVDSLFIVALLTILGFSVHDTIVVFDRIRENLQRIKTAEPFASTVNRSINETIGRSINTSLTVFLVLAAVFFFGGATTTYFALALMLGIFFGTYSSIFVASPLLVIWNNSGRDRRSYEGYQ